MNKKYLMLVLIIFIISCKKNEVKDTLPEVTGGKKYAKYRYQVSKGENLKEWLATLEKAEAVTVMDEISITTKKGEPALVYKVKLSDDKIGYILASHLGDQPLVFIRDAKAYIRPSPLVSVYAEIPAGTIGFTVDQKDGWTEVYVGKVDDKWVTSQWVEDDNYVKDRDTLIDARNYEDAISKFNDAKKANKLKGEELLNELKENARTELFRGLADKKLSPEETLPEGDKPIDSTDEMPTDDSGR